jgi:flagellar protein FliO/FliZ
MTPIRFFPVLRLFLVAFSLLALANLCSAAPADEKSKEGAVIYPRNAENKAESPAGAGHSSGYGSGILVVALLLAAAGGWLFWRGRATPAGTVNVRKLAIAETKSLGNRQYLVVAAYEDKKFLLSVCPGKIELLTSLDNTPPVKSS